MPKREEPRSEDREGAATIAARHLINPDEEKLVEVSYIPSGIVHPLVMLQAYEGQMNNLIEQVREMQRWYMQRQARRQKWTEEQTEAAIENMKKLDNPDLKNMFIHRFRHAFYQTSRGKDGKFVESLTILADTDLQTRSADMQDPFRSGIRGQ
jgi:hypothetical protein